MPRLSERRRIRLSLDLVFRLILWLRIGRRGRDRNGPIACGLSPLDLLGELEPRRRQIQCHGLVPGVTQQDRQAVALIGTLPEFFGVGTHRRPGPSSEIARFANAWWPRWFRLAKVLARLCNELGKSGPIVWQHRASNAGKNVVSETGPVPDCQRIGNRFSQKDYWKSPRTACIRSALSASRIQTSAILSN